MHLIATPYVPDSFVSNDFVVWEVSSSIARRNDAGLDQVEHDYYAIETFFG